MREEERRRELGALRKRLSGLKERYETTRKRAVDTREQLEAADSSSVPVNGTAESERAQNERTFRA